MLEIVGAISSGPQNLQVPIVIRTSKSESAKRDVLKFRRCHAPMASALLISIGKLKHTIGMITYRNISALDSKGKTAFKSFYL